MMALVPATYTYTSAAMPTPRRRGSSHNNHSGSEALLLLARIVAGIHVYELNRRHPVDLNHGLPDSHGVVMHTGVEVGKAARREDHHLARVEAVSHPDL